jgi:hypothetical protein
MSRFPNCLLALTLCLLISVCGCGLGGNRAAIEGAVTLDGQPVDNGSILFVPIEGTKSPTAGAVIAAGRYQIPRNKGPMAGVFRIEITAPRKTGKTIPARSIPLTPMDIPVEGGAIAEEVEAVPAHYNKKSTLRQELKTGANIVDFALNTKAN